VICERKRETTMTSFLLAVAATVVTCGNTNDTAAIQKAVDTSAVVQLVGQCKVDGTKAVRIPSSKTLLMDGATVRLVPGCASPGWPCRIFETVPQSGGIRLEAGEIIGDMVEQPSAAGYSIGLRVDTSAPLPGERWSVVIEGTKFSQWRSDAIYVGGNAPGSRGVRVTGVSVDGFGRNGFSVTHGDDISIERLSCRNAKVNTSPGACIDVESNPGERVTGFQAYDVSAQDVEVCVYMHKHQNATLQGYDYGVYRLHCQRARRHGIVMNSAILAAIVGSVITDAPIGISIGAFTEATRAAQVILSANDIESQRPVVLAGIRDSTVLLGVGGGRIEAPGLGTSGAMITSSAPPPAPAASSKTAAAAPQPPRRKRGQPVQYAPASKLSDITAPDDPWGLLKGKP
jgi:hypothetical protein